MFFVIELLPTIVKLATPLGEYDRQLHAHEQMFALALDTNFRILQQREQLRQRTELVIAQRLEQARQDKEIELGESVLNQTASIQNDLATRMLKEWGKQERDKLKPTATPKSPPAPGPAPAPAGATPPAPEPVVAAPPPPPVPPVSPANASITPAALLRRWGLQPDAMREWYQFENGASDNRVRRYIGKGLETGQWEHPNGDINCLRVTFGGDTTEYTIQRLTNTEMVLEDATTGRVLSFVS